VSREEKGCRHLIGCDDRSFDGVIVAAFKRAQRISHRSKREFANAIGVAPAALSLILTGEAEPTCSLLLKAATVAGQPLSAILGDGPLVATLVELEGKVRIMEALFQQSRSPS